MSADTRTRIDMGGGVWKDMRILPLIAATTLAGLALVPGAANAATKTCAKDGVCFTKTISGAKKTITVTGTAGNDKIALTNKTAFGNNSNSHIAVQGIDTQIDATGSVTLIVNGLAGDDQISLPALQNPAFFRALYATATVDGGAGNDTLIGADRADVLIGGTGRDTLDGGPGNDQLRALDGEVDVLHGGLGTDTAQRDAADKADGVEG
jgi:Ca2+-binding RTX toxin-like protein